MNYVIGDLHGNFTAVTNFMSSVGFNPYQDSLFVTGDFVNRGEQTEDLVDLFMQMKADKCLFSCLGNHELALISHYCKNPMVTDSIIQGMGGDWWLTLKKSKKDKVFEFLTTLQPHVLFHDDNGLLYGMCHAKPPNLTYEKITTKEIADCIQHRGIEKNLKVNQVTKYFVGHNKVKQPGPQSRSSNVYYMDAFKQPVVYGIENDQWYATDVTHETKFADGAAYDYAAFHSRT